MSSRDWNEVSLGEICNFKYGKSLPSSARVPGHVAVYGSNGPVGTHSTPLTDGHTIVIGRKGSFGEVAYCEASCWPIDTTYYIDSSATDVDLRWLYYRLRAMGLKELNRAAAIPGLNREDAYRKRLLLPQLSTQRWIAEVLDGADELRAKRRQAIALLGELTQSIFLDMFGNSNDVSRVPLGNVLTFMTSGGRGWAKYYSNSGARFIRSLDVQMNKIHGESAAFVNAPNNAEARRTKVATGDVLLTITGSLIGRVAPVAPDLSGSYISQHVAILRPDQHVILPEFLSFYLSLSSGGQRQIARVQYGQTKPGLNFKQIRDFEIPIPSLRYQREFADWLESLASLSSDQDTQLAELDSLFTSLQTRAFNGGL